MSARRLGKLPKGWHRASVTVLVHAAQVSNLYVADASLFPTSTGVNPMITVEAMSYMVAQGLAQKLRDGAVPRSQKAAFMPEE